MDYFNAFWIGGLICAVVQILLDRTKLMPGRVMVLLVCGGAILGALKIYQPFQELAFAGIREFIVERGKGSGRSGRDNRNLYRRSWRKRCRHHGGSRLWISCGSCL